MLACLARPERAPTAAVLNYLTSVNTVAVAERAEPLRGGPGGLYARALPLLVPRVALPAGFRGWEAEAEEDEDAFVM